MESSDKAEVLKSLILSVTISLWLYWLWMRKDLYRFYLKFPGGFGPPVLGALTEIGHMENTLTAFGKMFDKCRQHNICIWMGVRPVLLTDDPELIEKVLSSADFLNKAHTLYRPIYDLAKGGLVASPATEWAHNRKLIVPSFSHKILQSFFPVFNKAKNSSIDKLNLMDDNNEHHLLEIMKRISLGLTVETTMGKVMKEGDQVDEDLAEKFGFVMEKTSLKCLLAFVNLDGIFGFYRKYNQTKEYLYKYIHDLIEQKIKKISLAEEPATNFTTSAEDTKDKENLDAEVSIKKASNIFIDQAIQLHQRGQFSWNDIISESNTIVTASFETTANTVFSALVMLAMHPEYQERLFEEVVNVFPDKNFAVEYEHMQQLPYMDMVINETLRLTPSAPLIGRHVVKDTRLTKELIFPKDLEIMISIFHLHRRTDIWGPNAAQFDPDHFLPGNLAGKHSYAYMPFSKGMRGCIGRRYAEYSLKVLLSGLIRNYRFTTNFKYEDLRFASYITLRYVDEPKLTIVHRQ